MYGLLLAVIYLVFISLGLPDSLLGAGWPAIHTELNLPVSYMGFVSMTISCGTVISSLFSDKLTKKIGTRAVVSISIFLTVAALFGFSLSSRFWMLIVFAIPYGLGAGAIDAALNNYVALHFQAKYELVALFLGGRNDRQPVYYGLCSHECDVARRVSYRRIYTACDCNYYATFSAALESKQKYR